MGGPSEIDWIAAAVLGYIEVRAGPCYKHHHQTREVQENKTKNLNKNVTFNFYLIRSTVLTGY